MGDYFVAGLFVSFFDIHNFQNSTSLVFARDEIILKWCVRIVGLLWIDMLKYVRNVS